MWFNMAEENCEIQTPKLHLTDITKSIHTFCLELPSFTEEYDFFEFMKYNDNTWTLPFSFLDGNFSDVENSFNFTITRSLVTGKLIFAVKYKIKCTPWFSLNSEYYEDLDLLIVSDCLISLVHSKGEKSFVMQFYDDVQEDYRVGETEPSGLDYNDNCVEIKITITVTKRAEASLENLATNPFVTLPIKKVNESFSKYFLSEEFSDWKVVAGEKVFPAHRFVLSEISEFCKKMFSIAMTEKQDRVWNIEEFDPAVVKIFLEFAYRGTFESLELANDTEMLKELFRIAHKYEVVLLKAQCESLLKRLINDENVLLIYHLGYLYESKRLMAAAKIHFNRSKDQLLLNKVAFRELYKKFPPDMIYELTMK